MVGECGLLDRGEEKVRTGRGRGGVFSPREEAELEPESEEMTEVFLERSARVGPEMGVGWADWSGDGWVNWILSIPITTVTSRYSEGEHYCRSIRVGENFYPTRPVQRTGLFHSSTILSTKSLKRSAFNCTSPL